MAMLMKRVSGILPLHCCCQIQILCQPVPGAEFVSLEAAQPVLTGMRSEELKSEMLTASVWAAWVRKNDRAIRDRVERGEEDTLTNLLRFGVTFTRVYRIDDQYPVRYDQSSG